LVPWYYFFPASSSIHGAQKQGRYEGKKKSSLHACTLSQTLIRVHPARGTCLSNPADSVMLSRMLRLLLVLVSVMALLATGCKKSSGDYFALYTHEVLETNRQVFQVDGLVVEVKPLENSVTLKHAAVPGYMAAMTMPFDVKDTNLLTGLEPGDPVSFQLIVTDTYGYIVRIRKTGPKTNAPPTTGPFRLVRDVEPLKAGDLLPGYHFTNQLGQSFNLSGFKGQALAIEFLFTRCPFPTFCPLMAGNFQAAQTNLLAMTNGPANWQLLTISFDPSFDTPAVLKTYAENYHYDPAHWTFASGELIDVTAIGEQFGLTFWRDETGSISHNLRAAVIDASGHVQRIFTGNQWTPEDLVAELIKAAAVKSL
jgi:protein SCO1/2